MTFRENVHVKAICTFFIFMSKRYDYIITGAGCAGLSLLMRMINSKEFSGKKILLVDKSDKIVNDRTWCFWEMNPGFFEPLVTKRWNRLCFAFNGLHYSKQISPYSYKMIRGADFYAHCLEMINRQQNINFIKADVEKILSNEGETLAIMNGQPFSAAYIFNSIVFDQPALSPKQFYLLQHFKGWLIETKRKSFDPSEATLMDFRTNQENGTSFFYVMPFSETSALVEYTVFSEKLLMNEDYEKELKNYLQQLLNIDEYTIREEESGAIPMTNYSFPFAENNIINIGTAGGSTKASSGYTFQFIQKNSEALIDSMIRTGRPFIKKKSKKFRFYDSLFLNVLATRKLPGEKVFKAMFSRNKVKDIFDFLDDESTLNQDIRIIRSLPVMPFLKAAWQQII
jgi:lycopene beta-cyclase